MQPKTPFDHVRAFEADAHDASPAPKRLVELAVVAKKFVEVAFVVVALSIVAPPWTSSFERLDVDVSPMST